jgi:hypothetical protein
LTFSRRLQMEEVITINVRYEGDKYPSQIFQLHCQTQWRDLEAMVKKIYFYTLLFLTWPLSNFGFDSIFKSLLKLVNNLKGKWDYDMCFYFIFLQNVDFSMFVKLHNKTMCCIKSFLSWLCTGNPLVPINSYYS